MTPTLVFDIETIPDTAGLRILYELSPETSTEDVTNIALHKCRQQNGTDILPLHQHRICAISCALREGENFKVWTLGDANSAEAEIIQGLFDAIEQYTPQLISWNGRSFDLPVLHSRGLIHGINASRYWDLGEDDQEFKYNNYHNRYHTRHLDLMDTLAMFNGSGYTALDDLAKLCGFPGKQGMDGSKVWDAYKAGGIGDIRNYCETDVANTHLIFLRFKLMRGQLSQGIYNAEIALVRDTLTGYAQKNPALLHWPEFLAAWK